MKNVTDEQTVLDLEFDKILEWCSEYAFSERTMARILKTRPKKDFDHLSTRYYRLTFWKYDIWYDEKHINTRIQDLNKFDKISMCCFSNQGRPKKTAI